jgi:class 3 adenylate cyclase/pimeloyl-ACP methyl ester carboxylesterase
MSEREVRYCTTEDGVLIAYSVTGEGPPLLVCHEGLESFTLDHLITGQEEFFDELSRGRCLIRYDPRGIGVSQRDIEHFSLEAATRDLRAVVDATRLERVSMFAPCGGTLDAMAFAAHYPGRIDRLILYSASARFSREAKDMLGAITQLWRTQPRVATRTWADTVDRGRYPELCAQLATVFTRSTNPQDAVASIEQLLNYDVTDLLPRIEAPTLVIHRRGDRSNPIASAQGIAARIPKARLVMLEGDAHWYAMDPGGGLLAAVVAFLPEGQTTRPAAVQSAGSLRTVLFTDIVGHTEMMQRLGDTKGRDVLREHERITRETLKQHGGAEVKTMGDGFMASFGSVTSALDCAIALQRAFAAHTGSMPEPLHVRVGLNAGEPIEEDGDLFGATVILASRIAAKAGAGEILIPEPVRHLLAGKSFVFSDRGEFAMKGFDDAVRLYEVRWRPWVAAGDEDA